MAMEAIKLFDVVALMRDRPDLELRRGNVGAVVEVHGPDDFEVEFVDNEGRTYGLHTIRRDDLMVLRYESQKAAS